MTWFWLIGAVAAALYSVRRLVVARTGRTTPFPVVALAYLRQQLQVAGVLDRMPESCVQDIAQIYAQRIEFAQLSRSEANVELVKCIDAAAAFIEGWIDQGRDVPSGSDFDLPDGEAALLLGTGWLPEVLKEHRVALGRAAGA